VGSNLRFVLGGPNDDSRPARPGVTWWVDISGERYINCKEANMREGLTPWLKKSPIYSKINDAMNEGKGGRRLKTL
jgi:hypothetical protein